MHATKVANRVMELLSEGLGLEPGKFKELTFSDRRLFAGSCYPHCPQPELTMGLASHTDKQILTVLLTNRLPGLQVKRGDEWVDVKPLSGGLIINIGDFLQVTEDQLFILNCFSVGPSISNPARDHGRSCQMASTKACSIECWPILTRNHGSLL